jgi:acyl dehydratase
MRAGLDRPILHGLCTLGIAGRHVLHTFADDDPSRIGAMRVRFAGSVYPGDTLCTEMWQEGDDVSFRSSILETGDVVLSQASCRLNARAAARDARVVEG